MGGSSTEEKNLEKSEINAQSFRGELYRSDPRRGSFIVALFSAMFGLIGCAASALLFDIVTFFLCVEIITVSLFFMLCIILITSYFPKSVKASSIFFCGVGKPPYIDDKDVMVPSIPLLKGGYNEIWEYYYDSKKIKIESER